MSLHGVGALFQWLTVVQNCSTYYKLDFGYKFRMTVY